MGYFPDVAKIEKASQALNRVKPAEYRIDGLAVARLFFESHHLDLDLSQMVAGFEDEIANHLRVFPQRERCQRCQSCRGRHRSGGSHVRCSAFRQRLLHPCDAR